MEYRTGEDDNNERSFDNWSLWTDVDYPLTDAFSPYTPEDDNVIMVTYEASNDTEAFLIGRGLIMEKIAHDNGERTTMTTNEDSIKRLEELEKRVRELEKSPWYVPRGINNNICPHFRAVPSLMVISYPMTFTCPDCGEVITVNPSVTWSE